MLIKYPNLGVCRAEMGHRGQEQCGQTDQDRLPQGRNRNLSSTAAAVRAGSAGETRLLSKALGCVMGKGQELGLLELLPGVNRFRCAPTPPPRRQGGQTHR